MRYLEYSVNQMRRMQSGITDEDEVESGQWFIDNCILSIYDKEAQEDVEWDDMLPSEQDEVSEAVMRGLSPFGHSRLDAMSQTRKRRR